MSRGRSEMSWCWNNFSRRADAVTRDSARAIDADDDRAIFRKGAHWSPSGAGFYFVSGQSKVNALPLSQTEKGSISSNLKE